MREEGALRSYSHVPEPRAGSIRARDGRRADLFNVRHYPVRAVCRICGEPIEADSYFRPFAHEDGQSAVIYQFPLDRAATGPNPRA